VAADAATTGVTYTQQPNGGQLDVAPADGSFDGQVTDRSWIATFTNAAEPASVLVDGEAIPASGWTYDAAARTISVPVTSRPLTESTTVQFS